MKAPERTRNVAGEFIWAFDISVKQRWKGCHVTMVTGTLFEYM